MSVGIHASCADACVYMQHIRSRMHTHWETFLRFYQHLLSLIKKVQFNKSKHQCQNTSPSWHDPSETGVIRVINATRSRANYLRALCFEQMSIFAKTTMNSPATW